MTFAAYFLKMLGSGEDGPPGNIPVQGPGGDPAVGVQVVESRWAYGTATTNGSTIGQKTGAGLLHGLLINAVAAGTVTAYDNATAASGTIIGGAGLTFVAGGQPCFIPMDCPFALGLTVVSSAVGLTVTPIYR